jgi:hypothetical protein
VSEEISIKEIKEKKNEWFLEVERLGNITQSAYQFKDIVESLKYFDEKRLESFLVKRGEYLFLEYCSLESVIKNKIESESGRIGVVFHP